MGVISKKNHNKDEPEHDIGYQDVLITINHEPKTYKKHISRSQTTIIWICFQLQGSLQKNNGESSFFPSIMLIKDGIHPRKQTATVPTGPQNWAMFSRNLFAAIFLMKNRTMKPKKVLVTSGWWFGTVFIFPYIGNSHPN